MSGAGTRLLLFKDGKKPSFFLFVRQKDAYI